MISREPRLDPQPLLFYSTVGVITSTKYNFNHCSNYLELIIFMPQLWTLSINMRLNKYIWSNNFRVVKNDHASLIGFI